MTLIKRQSALAHRVTPFRLAVTDTNDPARGLTALSEEPAASANGHDNPVLLDPSRTRIAELEAALLSAVREKEEASVAAEERGYAKGLTAAETHEAERLDILRTALNEAHTTLRHRIDEEHDLAIDIARAALDRVFADPSLYRGMVVDTARLQASGLNRGTIVRLRVSAIDFPDGEALAALSTLDAGVKAEVDETLAAGACIFDLTLGMLDASIPHQLAVIESLFDQADRRVASG